MWLNLIAAYRSEPRERTITTTVLDSSMLQEITTNRELITPPPVPANLAPGPNTRVVKTVKTYTYELPGSPEKYMSSSSLSKSGDKIITYTVPDASEKTVTYQVEKVCWFVLGSMILSTTIFFISKSSNKVDLQVSFTHDLQLAFQQLKSIRNFAHLNSLKETWISSALTFSAFLFSWQILTSIFWFVV